MTVSDGIGVKELFLIRTGALDQIKDAIIAVDNLNRLTYLNRAASQQYHVDKDKAVGSKLTELYRHLWFSQEDEQKATLGLEQKGTWEGVNIHVQPSGEKLVVESVVSVIKDQENNKVGLLSIIRDITSRTDINNWLVESNQRLKYVVEAAGMMIYEVDKNTKHVNIIRGVEELLGYTIGEIPATVDWWVSQVHPNDVSKAKEQFYPTKNDEKKVSEYRIRNKEGRYIIVQSASKILHDSAGNLIRIIGSIQNITSRKTIQAELEDKTKRLATAERLALIGQVAGMVGHDIRNPLQAIISDAYLLENYIANMPQGQTKEDVKESIKSIEKNIYYINKIVADLQDYTKPLKPEPVKIVNLCSIIEELFSTLEVPSNIKAEIDCAKILPVLNLDLTFLKRILVNLATNAIQAMPKGGKLCVKVVQNADKAQIVVEDTGVGIPEELKPKMFTPMLTTKSKGQGFGLVVVKRYTEALGGNISFKSQEGKGTKFVVELPIK